MNKYLYKGQIVTASSREEASKVFASRGASLKDRTPDRFENDPLIKNKIARLEKAYLKNQEEKVKKAFRNASITVNRVKDKESSLIIKLLDKNENLINVVERTLDIFKKAGVSAKAGSSSSYIEVEIYDFKELDTVLNKAKQALQMLASLSKHCKMKVILEIAEDIIDGNVYHMLDQWNYAQKELKNKRREVSAEDLALSKKIKYLEKVHYNEKDHGNYDYCIAIWSPSISAPDFIMDGILNCTENLDSSYVDIVDTEDTIFMFSDYLDELIRYNNEIIKDIEVLIEEETGKKPSSGYISQELWIEDYE